MEAQDRVNEQLDSGILDNEPFEPVHPTDEQVKPDDPEDVQLDLPDRRDESFESVDNADEQTESDDPEDAQLDLQDTQEQPFGTVEPANEPPALHDAEETPAEADGQPVTEDPEEDPLESENRVSEQLDLLIGEIDRAVDMIQQLRQEITDLQQSNREQEERLGNQDQVISGLRADRERLRSIYDNNASLIENKEEIQRKIETMITRLDSINTA